MFIMRTRKAIGTLIINENNDISLVHKVNIIEQFKYLPENTQLILSDYL